MQDIHNNSGSVIQRNESVNRLRETNSAFERFNSSQYGNYLFVKSLTYLIVEHQTARPVMTQGENKLYCHKVPVVRKDGSSSRISTIDTNEYAKSNHQAAQDSNFLSKWHKRTKKSWVRYFDDARVSLPQIKKNSIIQNHIPFGAKKISWSKGLEQRLESLADSTEDSLANKNARFSDHYYYQPLVQKDETSIVWSPSRHSENPKNLQKHRTRNFTKGNTKTDTMEKRQKSKIFQEMSVKFLKNSKHSESAYLSQIDTHPQDSSNPNEPNLFSPTRSKGKEVEIPDTPSFANRKRR